MFLSSVIDQEWSVFHLRMLISRNSECFEVNWNSTARTLKQKQVNACLLPGASRYSLLIILASVWCGGTHVTLLVGWRWDCRSGEERANVHGPIVLSAEVNVWMWEQRNLLADIISYQMMNPPPDVTGDHMGRGWCARTCECSIYWELLVCCECDLLNGWTTLDKKLTTLCKYSYENVRQCKWWSLHILHKCFNIIVTVVYTRL